MGCHFGGLRCRLNGLLHPPVSYEWVLKKKHNWFSHGGGCNTCGTSAPVYATGQGGIAPSGQYGVPSGQYGGAYSAPQVYGAGQRSAFLPSRPSTAIASAPAEMTPAISGSEEVPPAPEVKESSANGSRGGLLLPTPSGN
jgi:hypothetical protein